MQTLNNVHQHVRNEIWQGCHEFTAELKTQGVKITIVKAHELTGEDSIGDIELRQGK